MKKYGLIGQHLTHSFSKTYFQNKIDNGLLSDFSYTNYELSSITLLPQLLSETKLNGFNVTIPYKESIIPFLNNLTPIASKLGAVNCVRIENGQLVGHNTDFEGFQKSIFPLLTPVHKNALILGDGGASQAVKAVLQELGIQFLVVSRNPSQHQLHYNQLDEFTIHNNKLIINCTPLGMFPHIEECAPLAYNCITNQHLLFDLIYNPIETKFLLKGKLKQATIKNGYEMLCIQADASLTFWQKA
jgi:shikimate dehydrogenase